MSEVQKRKLVIASVLKPVNDTRMTEKIGQSLAKTENFEVHVCGFSDSPGTVSGLEIHPHGPFKRISLERWLVPLRILRKTIELRPAILIITTHELLFISAVAKLITGCKVIYDVQENYFRNILYTTAFPGLLRPVLAGYVRVKEYLLSPIVSHFFLAEKGYAKELSFPGKRFTILENKLSKTSAPIPSRRNKYALVFSGTLAPETGVFKAIEIAILLHQLDSRITLTLIGYCAQHAVLEKIKSTIGPFSFITLIGGEHLVPHSEILRRLAVSGAGIVSYPPNPATFGATPTKLYEYLGLQLPIILVDHPRWVSFCAPFNAAIIFDYEDVNAAAILQSLETVHFYPHSPKNVFWESEESKLLAQIGSL
jgi:hypothetical protein